MANFVYWIKRGQVIRVRRGRKEKCRGRKEKGKGRKSKKRGIKVRGVQVNG